MALFKRNKDNRALNGRTPGWFKEWNEKFFCEVDKRSRRNEKLLYIIIGVVFGSDYLLKQVGTDLITLVKDLISSIG